MTDASKYKARYKEFSQNVDYAARTWHHHVHLNNRAAEDERILAALNKAARFWLDSRYSAIQTTIIFLGKVFDPNSNTFSFDTMLSSARKEPEHFSKEALRKRKIDNIGAFEGLDEYIKEASELNDEDIRSISKQAKKAKAIWARIKPLRDKVYAHSEILSDDERAGLYSPVKNGDITSVIQILLNISQALWQAEFNGRKPDFSKDHVDPINHARKNIESLIGSFLLEDSGL